MPEDIFSYIFKILGYWWTMLPGAIMEGITLPKYFWPQYEDFLKSHRLTLDQRKNAHIILLSGFIWANFMTFHEAKNESRTNQQALNDYEKQYSISQDRTNEIPMGNLKSRAINLSTEMLSFVEASDNGESKIPDSPHESYLLNPPRPPSHEEWEKYYKKKDEWHNKITDYNNQAVYEYNLRFHARVAEIHNEFALHYLNDDELEQFYNKDAVNTVCIKVIALAIRRLADQIKK